MAEEKEIRTELRVTYAHMIAPHRQRWLWAHEGCGVIPLGTGTIAAGIGGEGKSTFMLDLAAQLTQGELPGDLHGSKETVIIFGPEDDWPTVMVPRLIAAGADLQRVAQVQAATITETFTNERELSFPLDLSLLRQAVIETGARMVIIDPAPNLMDGDMNKVQDVRRSYGPLMALAQEHDLAIVLINHFGKGGGNVGAKLSGSHAWRDLTRSYLAFASDPETGERILTQDKNNYGTGRGSWKFTLESVDVPTQDGTTNVGKVRFLGTSELTVGELINREAGEESDDEDRNAAQEFIYDYLVNAEGQVANAADVMKAGAAVGFSKDEMKHARKRSKNPRMFSRKPDFVTGWVWGIVPEGATQTPQGAEGAKGASTYGEVAPTNGDTQGATKVPCAQEVAPSAPSSDQVAPSDDHQDNPDPDTPGDLFSHTGVYEPATCTHDHCSQPATAEHGLCEHHNHLEDKMNTHVRRHRKLCIKEGCPRQAQQSGSYCAFHIIEAHAKDKFGEHVA